MTRLFGVLFVVSIGAVCCSAAIAQQCDPALKEFTSKDGGFAILLTGDPQTEDVPDEKSKTGAILQRQYTVGGPEGAYIVSYQDNPGLKNAAKEVLEQGLKNAQESVRQGFGGNMLRSQAITLDKTYPGLAYECEIPAAQGMYRSSSYLVDGRLYQMIVVGTKDFVTSQTSAQVLNSFRLLK